jgi:ZIP family zinc transporter
MSQDVLYAFALTLFAGLATGIGSCIAFFYKKDSKRFLSFALGLSAGVMIYISFMELLFEARLDITGLTGNERLGLLYTVLAFLAGIGFAALIDTLVPHGSNPHHPARETDDTKRKNLERIGVATAIAIAAHNLPEGLATFVSSLDSLETGIAVAIAVSLHNIPVGIAISAPIYAATGRKRKALVVALLSGLAELAGALIAWLALMPLMSPMTMSLVFAAVAGIMVFISLDSLLPAAREYGEGHIPLYGLITGIVLMSASMIILE